jgi:dihydrofolate synthase / folylpolyglutamate synthase
MRTGLFTSPHLVDITERIKISGKDISRFAFADLATTVRDRAEFLVQGGQLDAPPTFFEQVTAIALLAFRQANVDLAILETGLGGRLDSTTAARAETVAITSIALDHQEYLGETLAEIAAEKAAIIRPGVTAIIASQPQDALDVILQRCQSVDVTPHINGCKTKICGTTTDGRIRVTFETGQDCYQDLVLGLRGRHQVGNVSLAIQLAEALRERGFQMPREAIRQGVEQARHPGRLELWDGEPRLLFDGAHNPAGAAALREYLDEFITEPITLVFGAMRDKNLAEMAEILFSRAQRLILTQPDNLRSATLETLQQYIPNAIADRATSLEPAPNTAILRAREQTPADGLICVTGSLYLVGEIQEAVRRNPRDQFAKQAQRN